MASYSAGLGGRKLKKVNTFKDLSRDRPSSPHSRATAGPSMAPSPGYQPGGFGPQANSGQGIRKPIDPAIEQGLPGGVTTAATGSGYTAPAATAPTRSPYSEARAGEVPGAFGAPAAGFPQRSPWFGAGDPFGEGGEGGGFGTPPTDPEEEAEPVTTEEGQAQAGVPGGYGAGVPDVAGGLPDLGGFGLQEWDPSTGRYTGAPAEEAARGTERGVEGLDPQERRGIVGPDAPTGARTPEDVEQDRLDAEHDRLMGEIDLAQENAQNKLDAAFAQSQRRNAEINAAMGTSVSGGYAGVSAQSTLDYLQQMADMFADFQQQKTNLQLGWLDRRLAADTVKEERIANQNARLIEHLLASEQEIPEHLWEKAFGAEAGIKKAQMLGAGGEAGDVRVPEGTLGEPGSYENEFGDALFAGGNKVGHAGKVAGNPWEEDAEEVQWYVDQSGEEDRYYQILNGEQVYFQPGIDGGRHPGDTSFYHRAATDQQKYDQWGYTDLFGYESKKLNESALQHPDSVYPVEGSMVQNIMDQFATLLGFDDHTSMFGNEGLTIQSMEDPFKGAFGGRRTHYSKDNDAVPFYIELAQFMSLKMHETGGTPPTNEEIFAHLQEARMFPGGINEQENPYSEVG